MRSSLFEFRRFLLFQSPMIITSPVKLINKLKFSTCAAVKVEESEHNGSLCANNAREVVKVSDFKSENMLRLGRKRLGLYSAMLNDCAVKGCLNKGKAVHGHMVRNGVELDKHLWVCLINMYSKRGGMLYARKVLDAMPKRDVVAWTALIAGFVGQGYGSDGVRLFCEMRKEGVHPNEFTMATGLKACSMCSAVEFGKQVHAEGVKLGLDLDLFVGSALVDLYAKCGEVELAKRVFFFMPEQNSVSWNALLNSYALLGDGEKVFELFCKMTGSEVRFSKFTLSTVLKGCASTENFRGGQCVHSLAIKVGCELNEFISCGLVDMYAKCGMADSALRLFKRIKYPDVVTWSAMIACLDKQGLGQEALEAFKQMLRTSVKPNQYCLASLISAASSSDNLRHGEILHSLICKYGFESDTTVGNALITMYMKKGCPQASTQVFESMTEWDTVSWNARISGFYETNTGNQGPKIFRQMLAEGFEPNMYTFISILRSCSSLLDAKLGRQVHAQLIKNNFESNDFVCTALTDMYANIGCIKDAELIFNKLSAPDIFSWTVMIASYVQTDQAEEAVRFLKQMQRDGVKPNEYSLASCLSGCSQMAALQNGKQLHSIAIKCGHFVDLHVSSALADMYMKCGCLEDAEAIFEGLVSQDTVLWNTMIFGYSQHGQGEKALKAYKTMLNEGNKPDEITFLGVLSACSHMGLVEEGRRHLNSLNKYGIIATTEHYACMVNILGRAGKFDEVESFIQEMNLSTEPLVWETVLGACKLHGNVELGEIAAYKLFDLDPSKDSNYVSLSNIYAAKERWNDVRNARVMMTSRGVKKEPGCSWVEVDGQVHVFTSQDSSHPNIEEICFKLEELGPKLTSVGYVPKTEYVLQNVVEDEKIKQLHNHSERLALAFALKRTKPFKAIRIFKNLRICGDCHDFMKFVSNITNRDIVIRDISRFHHFKNGACSCQDHW